MDIDSESFFLGLFIGLFFGGFIAYLLSMVVA